MDLGSQHGAGGKVDRMLGLVSEMGGATLHLGDSGIGISCRLPVAVGQFLSFALTVEAHVDLLHTGIPHELLDVVEAGNAGRR